ncbi:MAG: diphthamide biosynthesis enzyme Dph2 [Thermoplasmataceae archaeon]
MQLEIQDAILKLRELGARKILLQLPDGLKPDVFKYFTEFSREFSVIVSSDPFYGACDIGNQEVYGKVDAIVQLGHSVIPNIEYPLPVIFIEYRSAASVEIDPHIFDVLSQSGYTKIGLLASIQYMDHMEKVRQILASSGYQVQAGRQDSRMAYPGQVLGCNFSAAHSISAWADCYVVVSTGKFHGIGAQLASDKPVYILDLNLRRLVPMADETDQFLRRRYARISKALDANKFCVVVDTKIGQYRMKLASHIVKQVMDLGHEAVLITANDARPTDYENMRCDAVIFTGCPRVPIDEEDRFPMPVLTPPEFQSLFVKHNGGRYIMDEIVAVDRL